MKALHLLLALGAFGCKQGDFKLHESGNFAGLYSLGVNGGSPLSGQEAINEVGQYCNQQNLPGYVDKIAKRLSFNAGYAEHPNAGYDAALVKQQDGYVIGNGQMFDGAGSLAMFPPNNGNISRLIAGYCGVVMASLGQGGGDAKLNFGAAVSPKCAYPTIEVTKGGSVSGNSAAGSIDSGNCIIAKMKNGPVKHAAEIAFCPEALGGNFKTGGDGAAGEMSIIIRGGN
jgi:hypothetical protein